MTRSLLVVHQELYRLPHEDDGLTYFYEDDKLVRKERRSPHKDDGRTELFEDGRLVRREFRSPHEHAGITVNENDKFVQDLRSRHKAEMDLIIEENHSLHLQVEESRDQE